MTISPWYLGVISPVDINSCDQTSCHFDSYLRVQYYYHPSHVDKLIYLQVILPSTSVAPRREHGGCYSIADGSARCVNNWD